MEEPVPWSKNGQVNHSDHIKGECQISILKI